MVRGALMALSSCYLKTVSMAAASGAAVGGAFSGALTGLTQLFTGEINAAEIAEAIGDGMIEGGKEGALLAANPFAYSVYSGFQTFTMGLEFWKTLHSPDVPMYQKYMQAVGFITSALPAISPKLARKMNDLFVQKFCFPAGTEIATADGSKPIEDIREGDEVWAQSDRTGETALKRVKHVFRNVAAALVVLHCGTNTLEATPLHPLWVADKGWLAAEQVSEGDELWTLDGRRAEVTGTERKQGRFTVYNFEVDDFHTYFVGKDRTLAHNQCVNVTLMPGWSVSDFSRKARALKDLAQRGLLRKASNTSAMRHGGQAAFKQKLRDAAARQYATSDPAKYRRLMDKIGSMHADHMQDLQLGGLDDVSNLWLLDAEVNMGIGSQIWQQIKDLTDGTVITDINIIGL